MELTNVRFVKIFNEIKLETGFRKIEFIVATDEEYPQLIKFELHNDKYNLISIFPGDTIDISFNIRGREWINNLEKVIYFTSFVAWKIKKIENGYQVPIKENSPHIQYQFKLPPADEVFGN